MKILITGADGMLAKAVKAELNTKELICTNREQLDITDEGMVMDFVTKEKPNYIINCAAYTEVDNAENNKEVAYNVNSLGTRNLSNAAKKNDAILVHISTDYVFDGNKKILESYKESDLAIPKNIYGKSKLQGEINIQNNYSKYYIFRTSWLFGEGRNFVKTMIELGRKNKEISVVCDEYGSPTYTEDLAKIIHQAIDKKIPYGIYHATNQGFTTWYEFTKRIFKITNIDCKVNPITAEEFKRIAKRPTNSKLSKEKLLKQGINIKNYKDALNRYLKKYKLSENLE